MKTLQFTEDQIVKLLQEGKKGEKPVGNCSAREVEFG